MAVAEVYDLPIDDSNDELDEAFGLITDAIRRLPTTAALATSNRMQNRLLALDSELVAREIDGGAGDREVEDLAGRGTTHTKREAKRRANRAKAVNANPALAVDLATGELLPAGLDALADAADQSEGAAAHDAALIERIKSAPPDRARGIAKRWLDERTTPDEHERRYERQRRLRKVTKYPLRNGLMGITAEGDREAIDEIWSVLSAESKRLYRQDGGRDLPSDKHPRTRHQRLFDAFHAAVTTGDPTILGAKSSRSIQVFVTLTLDELLDGATKARLVGGGTIPRQLLDEYLTGDARVAGMLFDGNGQVLWHGRNRRWATAPQIAALIARDEGCALCEAHPSGCDSHHLIPYNSPAQGLTNADELALLCTDCHHHIHATNQTLYCEPDPRRRGNLVWRLRPATAEELPP